MFPESPLLMAVRFPEKEGVRYHDGGQVFSPEVAVMRKVDAQTFDVRRIETDGRQERPPMFLNCPSPPAAVPFADDGGEVPCARIQGTHAVRGLTVESVADGAHALFLVVFIGIPLA